MGNLTPERTICFKGNIKHISPEWLFNLWCIRSSGSSYSREKVGWVGKLDLYNLAKGQLGDPRVRRPHRVTNHLPGPSRFLGCGFWVLKSWKSWVNQEELIPLRPPQLCFWYTLWWTAHVTSPHLLSSVHRCNYPVLLFYRGVPLPYQTSLNSTTPTPEHRCSSGIFFNLWEHPETSDTYEIKGSRTS